MRKIIFITIFASSIISIKITAPLVNYVAQLEKESIFLPFMLAAFFLTVILIISSLLSKKISEKVTASIKKIDLDDPQNCEIYDEFVPLIRKFKKKNDYFTEQYRKLQKRKNQFEIITANMQEGLMILDDSDKILFCNKRTIRILGAEDSDMENYVNQSVLALCREEKFRNGIKFPPNTEKIETIFDMYGRTIKMTANQIVRKQDEKIGTAVLLSDITEQANREKLRREFSANVSHELKTPLTVISGFAELMANGAVKASDIKTFSEKIHTESKHLLSLINDIIELSKLDENSNLTFEKVDLYDFAKESMERIKEKADEKNISLDLTGEEAKIEAVAYLLDEILFNILDNAVKYNRENGKIVVEIKQEKGSAVLLVSDTGIGIAKAEQSRVFERFYRIDSSRGGRQDGTGLGLSIVKNAVQINGGKISLSSVEGEWTRVSVKFPLSK